MKQPDSAIPENSLEETLVRGKAGQLSLDECACAVLNDWLYVPSKTEVDSNGFGFAPIIVENSGRLSFVVAFTSLSKVSTVSDKAKFCVRIPGRDLVKRIPHGLGILVNPGFQIRLDLTPSGIDQLQKMEQNFPDRLDSR